MPPRYTSPKQLRNVVRGKYGRFKGIEYLVVRAVQREIERQDLIYKGRMRDSVGVEETRMGTRRVVIDVPYSVYVDLGTRPYRPPFNPIYEWVLKKIEHDEKRARKITWAIINTVGREGFKPKWFVKKAIRSVGLEIVRRRTEGGNIVWEAK